MFIFKLCNLNIYAQFLFYCLFSFRFKCISIIMKQLIHLLDS